MTGIESASNRPIQQNPNLLDANSTQNLPLKPLGKTSLRQDLGDIKLAFKIIGIWIAVQFFKLSGNIEQQKILKHKIRHLEKDFAAHEVQNDYSKNILVTARNMMKLEPIITSNSKNSQSTARAFVEETKNFLHKIGLESIYPELLRNFSNEGILTFQLSRLNKNVKEGVCAGACIDFAEKILREKNLDTNKILEIADGFKTGAPTAAVINQFASNMIIDNAARNHVYRHLSDNSNYTIQESTDNIFDDAISGAKEIFDGFKSFFSKTTDNNSNVSSKAKNRSTNYTNDFSFRGDLNRYDLIAKARGLELSKNMIVGKKNDEESLTLVKDLKEGVYELAFNTSHTTGHATLLIKSGNQTFFWDPNIGLLKCDENDPEKIILKILKNYPRPKDHKKNNHVITLKKMMKV